MAIRVGVSRDEHAGCRTLRAADSMFTAPVTYQAQEEGVAPLRSICSYRSDQEALGRYNKLREAGLSEGEVAVVVGGGERRGVAVEPSAMVTRLSTIQEVGVVTLHNTLPAYTGTCPGVYRNCLHMLRDWRTVEAVVVESWP